MSMWASKKILAWDKSGRPLQGQKTPLRDRRGEVLLIDARRMGRMVDLIHRKPTEWDNLRAFGFAGITE